MSVSGDKVTCVGITARGANVFRISIAFAARRINGRSIRVSRSFARRILVLVEANTAAVEDIRGFLATTGEDFCLLVAMVCGLSGYLGILVRAG